MNAPEPRMIASWQALLEGGKTVDELLVSFDRARERRVLILPALFDEANKLRRFTLQMMRAADELGVDTFLPDLPGCNESLVPLETQTLTSWRDIAASAAEAFGATHVLSIRGGALIAPDTLTGWQYAPLTGAKLLRGMLRAQTIASREAGREMTSAQLMEEARQSGLQLAGWNLGPQMVREIEVALPGANDNHMLIEQKDLGGAGLWLRAEPDEDQRLSEALAEIVAHPAERPL
ncbi:MAG: hypothetical protein ABJ205_14695 [Erythrobacter sp.]|uniref:hypothetical protein n=1 Tax=Erythrobacter sp. TaxID=1042 RepID=UPI0032676A09